MNPQKTKRAIQLFQKKISLRNIIRQLQVSQKTVRRIKRQFDQTGTIRPTKDIHRKKTKSEWKQKQMDRTRQIITNCVRSNCAVTLRGIKQELAKHGTSKQISTITRYLKQLKYSRKKLRKIPMERNTKEKLIYRQKYCQMIQQIPLQNLIFLDETSFNQHTTPYFGWAKKGFSPSLHIPASKRKSISLLAAVSIKGFQGTKIVKGPITHKHVCQFLQHYLDHLQPHEVLVLDNARVHHAAAVKQKIAQLKRPVRYLPAYTPQLNPIENIFSQIKSQFLKRRQHSEISMQELNKLITDSVKNINSKCFTKYFQHYEQWVKKGIAGELFI